MHNEKKQYLQSICWTNLDSYVQEWTRSLFLHKTQLQMNQPSTSTSDPIETLDPNWGISWTHWHGKGLSEYGLISTGTRTLTGKWALMRVKKLYTTEDTVIRVKGAAWRVEPNLFQLRISRRANIEDAERTQKHQESKQTCWKLRHEQRVLKRSNTNG